MKVLLLVAAILDGGERVPMLVQPLLTTQECLARAQAYAHAEIFTYAHHGWKMSLQCVLYDEKELPL